ncbi:hypothetical protein ACFYUL_17795 [Streptomyces sp. NPDC004311]|uniref:hypothetical protein n=1 Tax=Streptomyces sp. NPDC004311 TaxID=3364698 RepID=UPI003677068F
MFGNHDAEIARPRAQLDNRRGVITQCAGHTTISPPQKVMRTIAQTLAKFSRPRPAMPHTLWGWTTDFM